MLANNGLITVIFFGIFIFKTLLDHLMIKSFMQNQQIKTFKSYCFSIFIAILFHQMFESGGFTPGSILGIVFILSSTVLNKN
ncbi:MAG: hypothetical protein D3923_11990 [Candidatus Electrothrix sp. AR3]|nr:hypothetical protein [Candidatus Electrothrix sp. AR3]